MTDAAAAKPAETAADAQKAEAPKVEAPRRALDRSFGLESFKYNTWAYDLDEPFTFDDVMKPDFWATQAHKLMGHDKQKGRGDILRVRELRTGAMAEYQILELGVGYVKVNKIREAAAPSAEIPESSPLTTRYNIGKRTHEVIRKADGNVLMPGFQSKAAAAAWIAEHSAKTAA